MPEKPKTVVKNTVYSSKTGIFVKNQPLSRSRNDKPPGMRKVSKSGFLDQKWCFLTKSGVFSVRAVVLSKLTVKEAGF